MRLDVKNFENYRNPKMSSKLLFGLLMKNYEKSFKKSILGILPETSEFTLREMSLDILQDPK